ncbi:MAG: fatty acid desaturase [Shimia sp.]
MAHLARHLGVLALGAVWIAQGWPLWWAVLVPYGVALVFLFTLAHEATHKTPFATPWLNEVGGHLAGLPLLLPFQWFRAFHMAHHRFTNDPERDPELAGPHPDTWRTYMWHVSGIPYWRAMARVLWENATGRPQGAFVSPRQVGRLTREARLYVTVYGLAAVSLFFSPLLLWVWVIPALLGQPMLRLYLLAEHGRCPPVANMLENSRTTLTNQVVRFLAWNMPYHAEHHAYPQVPFHQLPAFYAHTRSHLRSTSQGYARFTADYVEGLER